MKAQNKVNSIITTTTLLLLLIPFGVVSLFAAGSNSPFKFKDWNVVGPSGGDVRVITIDPRDKNRIYISTLDGQIHTSANAGNTWELLVNFNRPQLILDQLMVDSQDSNILYTSGHRHKESGGFFKSTDRGRTWQESSELKKASIHSMTQSEKNPNVLMVGTIDGVWISRDKGDSWDRINSPSMPINIDSMAIDPRSDDTIFAGTWYRPYKSTDGGRNWRLIKDGMIDDSDVFAITINPRNPNHLVASACSGIYQSFNNGEKWSKLQGIPSQSRRTRDILQHPTIEGRIYAATTEGFWMTTNGGTSWSLTTQRELGVNSIVIHPDEPEKIYIGTNNEGVMVSEDGGRNFVKTNGNFTSRFAYSITPDIESPNRLFAITHNTAIGGGFVFISPDSGRTWNQSTDADLNRVSPFAIIQDRITPSTVYLATNKGIFQSLNRGVSWKKLVEPKPRRGVKPPVRAPNFSPTLDDKVKVLTYTQDGQNGFLAGTDAGLYRSYDVLKGWEKLNLGSGNENIFAIASSALRPKTIWVGTAVTGVMVSKDNGETWQKIQGIPDGIPVSSITIDPQNPDKMYIGTAATFYLTTDAGQTWVRRGGNLPFGNYSSVLINPRNTDEIYAASSLQSDGGIYFSADSGLNWQRIDSRDLKLPSHRIWGLAFDPLNSDRIFAATHSSGIYLINRQVPPLTANQVETRPREVLGN